MKGLRWDNLLTPILGIVLGIYLLARPGTAAEALCSLIGWLILLAGVVGIITSISFQHATMLTSPMLPFSVVGTVIGLFIVTQPAILAGIVSLILCIFLLMEGASSMQAAFFYYSWADSRLWLVPLIIGVLALGVGLWMLFFPLESAILMMQVIGVSLIVSGVINLLSTLFGRRGRRNQDTKE